MLEHLYRILAEHIHMPFEDDLVLRKRAGFVSAKRVHGSKILDRIKALHDDLPTRHHHRVLGQRGGDDHRQHFRREPHGDRDRKQKGFAPVILGKSIDQEDNRHHHQHKTDQQPAHSVDTLVERCWLAVSDNFMGQATKVSLETGGHHYRRRLTTDHVGTHETEIGNFQRIADLRYDRLGRVA